MKFVAAVQLAQFLRDRTVRQNVRVLLKYLALLFAVIAVYSVVFHVLMVTVERQQHSWLTGVYWTLTVMSTLGFGDITFHSDIGRAFSIVVLLSGSVLLLIVLPFVFIRYFYAPWLEAQVRFRAPRHVAGDTCNHVLICAHETIASGLIERLRLHEIPYAVIEPDHTRAAGLHDDGVSVISGDVESRTTYESARAAAARMVVANLSDTVNTNITLTVREVAPELPITALVDDEDSIDILELAGATHVLPLKQRLGEHLANRINAGYAQARVIGRYRDLHIAEFPVHKTPLVGRTVRETGLREALGLNVVAVWERGRLLPVHPETRLTASSVPVVIGTAEQLGGLDELLVIYDTNYHPVLVIGAGKVGRATTQALKRKDVAVHVIDRDDTLCRRLTGVADRVLVGDAADRSVLLAAGLADAPAVVLTTNDDAMNIYLTVYCRRLNPELRIVSRITHERNIEAIHRAGADFVLSYATLGVETIFAHLQGRESVIIGEGVDLFHVSVPRELVGQTLAESGIGARCHLNVIAVEYAGRVIGNPAASFRLPAGAELVMLGSPQQRQTFTDLFG